jgi:hypothetical protein
MLTLPPELDCSLEEAVLPPYLKTEQMNRHICSIVEEVLRSIALSVLSADRLRQYRSIFSTIL